MVCRGLTKAWRQWWWTDLRVGETWGRLLEEMVVSSCHCGDSGLFVAAIAQTYARDTAATSCFALASLFVSCRGLLASRVARACAAWAHINPATTSGWFLVIASIVVFVVFVGFWLVLGVARSGCANDTPWSTCRGGIRCARRSWSGSSRIVDDRRVMVG